MVSHMFWLYNIRNNDNTFVIKNKTGINSYLANSLLKFSRQSKVKHDTIDPFL